MSTKWVIIFAIFSCACSEIQQNSYCKLDVKDFQGMVDKANVFRSKSWSVNLYSTFEFFNHNCDEDIGTCTIEYLAKNYTHYDRFIGHYKVDDVPAQIFEGMYSRGRASEKNIGFSSFCQLVRDDDNQMRCNFTDNYFEEMEKAFDLRTDNLLDDVDTTMARLKGYSVIGQKFLRDLLTMVSATIKMISVEDYKSDFILKNILVGPSDDNKWETYSIYHLPTNEVILRTKSDGSQSGKYLCPVVEDDSMVLVQEFDSSTDGLTNTIDPYYDVIISYAI